MEQLSEMVCDAGQPLARRLVSARALRDASDSPTFETLVALCGNGDLGPELLRELGRSLAYMAVRLGRVKDTYALHVSDMEGEAYLEFSNEVAVLTWTE